MFAWRLGKATSPLAALIVVTLWLFRLQACLAIENDAQEGEYIGLQLTSYEERQLELSQSERISSLRRRLREGYGDQPPQPTRDRGQSASPSCSPIRKGIDRVRDGSVGFEAALHDMLRCLLDRRVDNLLENDAPEIIDEMEGGWKRKRTLLLTGRILGGGGGIASDLIGFEGLLGGIGLSGVGNRIESGPLGFGIGPAFTEVEIPESEMQGVQQQYSVNYQRGPWNVQTGFQVGVMAQDIVDDTFFLQPPGTPGAAPPPVLQSPQSTFEQAFTEAYNIAFPNGYSQGFTQGQVSSVIGAPQISIPSLPANNPEGYNEGVQAGWVRGITEGYTTGFEQARLSAVNNTATAQAIVEDSPTTLLATTREDPAAVTAVDTPEPSSQQPPDAVEVTLLDLNEDIELPRVTAQDGPEQPRMKAEEASSGSEAVKPENDFRPEERQDKEQKEEPAAPPPDSSKTSPKKTTSTDAFVIPVVCGAVAISIFFFLVVAFFIQKYFKAKAVSQTLDDFMKEGQPKGPKSEVPVADGPGYWGSIAKVLKWNFDGEEDEEAGPPTAKVGTSLERQSSAYMKDATMFDFSIYNPATNTTSCPSSPCPSQYDGCDDGQEFLPTNRISAGISEKTSKINVKVKTNGW